MIENVLNGFEISEAAKEELRKYMANRFNTDVEIPSEIEDEPFIAPWKAVINLSKTQGIEKALNEKVPHGNEDIKLKSPKLINIEIYNSVAGNIPVIYARDEEDFYELVTKLVHKGKEMPGLKKTGACFAFGLNNKFVILSNKPYSNVPAERLGLEDGKWRDYSIIIRREHECTHYFTKRFLGSSQNNLHDELIADFAGIYCAVGTFYADWFLIGMGIEEGTGDIAKGRFPVYTSDLSNEAKEALRQIIITVSRNVEAWSNKPEAKGMSRNERILFLCKNSLADLYYLQ
ncbi:MAG: hypothetical protein IJ758_02210 [Clostridia bacterium]|nr:hypothetical protein [Clostridia bacterium]